MRSSAANLALVARRRLDRRRSLKAAATGTAAQLAHSKLQGSPPCIKPVFEGLETRTMLAAGWAGSYYANMTLAGDPAIERTDATINFAFGGDGNGGPGAPIGPDNFSASYEAIFTVPATGTYKFYTESDDGVRMWMGGQIVSNHWVDRAPVEDQDFVLQSLTQGQQIPIVIHFYENGGGAVVRLRYEATDAGIAKQIVPASTVSDIVAVPTAPSGLTASNVTAFGADLSWIDNANNEARYKVQRLNPSTNEWQTITTFIPNTTTATVAGLAAGQTHRLRVVASNSSGDTAISNEVEVTTPGLPGISGNGAIGEYFDDAVNTTGNFTGTGARVLVRKDDGTQADGGAHAGPIDFVWGGGSPVGVPADDFSVRWSGKVIITTAGTYVFTTASDDGSILYVNGELAADNSGLHGTVLAPVTVPMTLQPGQYSFVMFLAERGGDATGRLGWTPPGGALGVIPLASLLAESDVPDAAINLAGTAGRDSASLTWQDVSTEEYASRLEFSTDNGTTWQSAANLLVTVNPGGAPANVARTVTGLSPGTAYQFRVVTQNFAGESVSNVLSLTTETVTGGQLIDSTPLDPTVTGETNLTAEGTLDWRHFGYPNALNRPHQKAGVVGPRISNFTALGGGTAIVTDTTGKTFSWTDDINNDNVASPGTTDAIGANGVGRGFRVTVPASSGSTRRTTIYVSVDPGTTGTLEAALADSSATAITRVLANPTGQILSAAYTFDFASGLTNSNLRLSWIASAGSGNVHLSSVIWKDTQLAAPASNLVATATGKGRIALTWDDNAGNETAYQIFRAPNANPTAFELIGTVGANRRSFVDAELADLSTWHYQVVAVNGIGASAPSNTASDTTNAVLFAGLRGDYFHIPTTPIPPGPLPETPVMTRRDDATQLDGRTTPVGSLRPHRGPVDFLWGTASPPGVQNERFAGRWTGRIIPDFTGLYTFYTDTDDGARLWIDLDNNGTFEANDQVIEAWFEQGAGTRENSSVPGAVQQGAGGLKPGGIPLVQGQLYNVKMEFYENGGGANAHLWWSGDLQPDEIIPIGATVPPPAPPPQGQAQNLVATALNSGRVGLEWSYNGPEVIGQDVQFFVSRAPDTDPANPVNIGLVSRTNFVDSTAQLNTRYHYYVTPVTFGGEGTRIGPAAATTIPGPVGTGAQATYFDQAVANPASKTPVLNAPWPESTVDPTINHFWGAFAPPGATGNHGPNGAPFDVDNFAVVWTFRIKPEFTETYTFFTETDDGFRLNVGGNLLQDRLDARQGMTVSPGATMNLVAGQEYDVVFTMIEEGGDAGARLYWQSAHVPFEIVPQAVMFPIPPDTTPPTISEIEVDDKLPATATYRSQFHILVRFSEPVSGANDEFKFKIISPTVGELDGNAFDITPDPASNSLVFTFDPISEAKLMDGNYTFQLLAGGITDSFGNTAAPVDIPFYVLQGDTQKAHNGDDLRNRKIGFEDYQILQKNFGMQNASHAEGDFTHDGIVNEQDFLFVFGDPNQGIPAKFGNTLAAGAAPVASPPPAPVPIVPVAPTPRPAPRPVAKPIIKTAPVQKVAPPAKAVTPAKPPAKTFSSKRVGAKDLLA